MRIFRESGYVYPSIISPPMHAYLAKEEQERIAVILKRGGDEKIS